MRKSSRKMIVLSVMLTLLATAANAEKLTVERAFAAPGLSGEDVQGLQLSPDGRSIAFLRPAGKDGKATALWIMPAKGGKTRRLLDSRTLSVAPVAMTEQLMKFLERRHLTAGAGLQYQWSARGDSLLVSFAGDLFLVSASDRRVQRVTKTDTLEFDPQLAPDGARVSFTRGSNLYIRTLADNSETAVGADASDTVSYGTVEFVVQEEFQRFAGSWWSPTGNRLAYSRVDEGPVTSIPRIKIGAGSIDVTHDRFPLAGTANANVKLFVRSVTDGHTVTVDLGNTSDIYICDAAWSRDGATFYVQRLSHDQKTLDLLAIDPTSGASRVILTEKDRNWVSIERDFRPLRDGNFLWGSGRSGWRHLYLYDRSGALVRAVTSGAWRIANLGAAAPDDFSSITGVDEEHGDVYFVASRGTPVEQQLYRISYRYTDTPHAITTGHGWWMPKMAADKPTAFIGRYSNPETPPQTGLYALDGRRIAWLAENRLDVSHPLFPYLDHRPSYEFGSITAADGATLQTVIVKPAGFDPMRRYPVIVRVYAGPGVQVVTRAWRSQITDQLLTQAGYVVFQLDSRGTINRDEAFEHALAGDLGGVNTEDQLAGVRYLRSLPFIDPDRVGMMGWSFGGYITMRAITTAGSGVRSGAAGGIPSRFELYDTAYTERYLGTPQANPQAYARSNLLPHLKDLHGNALILHGLSDDNVMISNLMATLDELQKNGKIFETAVYPGQGHGFRGQATLTQLWRTYLDFFDRRLSR